MQATRLVDRILNDSGRSLGRIVDVGCARDGTLAVAIQRGRLSRTKRWLGVQDVSLQGAFATAVTTPLRLAQGLLGRLVRDGEGRPAGHIVDLILELAKGRVTWVVLSQGLWPDLVQGRSVVPLAEVFAPGAPSHGDEVPPLRLTLHGAGRH